VVRKFTADLGNQECQNNDRTTTCDVRQGRNVLLPWCTEVFLIRVTVSRV